VDLHLGCEPETDRELIDTMIPHIHRIQQLSLLGHQRLRYNPSISLAKPAPLLEKLLIRCPLEGGQILLFNDQAPRIGELVIHGHRAITLQNQLGNLTSLHLIRAPSTPTPNFLPFFDMLRRCPALEEMFVFWGGWGVVPMPPQLPTIPLHRLRRLFISCTRTGNVKTFLHTLDLKPNGIAIRLSGMNTNLDRDSPISDIQSIFPNDRYRPSLAASTKFELIFHTRPRTVIMHAVGPGFAIRLDLSPEHLVRFDWTFHNVFHSVKELWFRGPSRAVVRLGGIEHFTALEKLVLLARGPSSAQNFRQMLSPDPSGVLPCPLLSTVDCHGGASDVREMFLLARTRFNAGCRLEELRVPSSFIPLPADIASCVESVRSFNIPPRVLHVYAMELPEFCFTEREPKWWKPWRSRLN